MGRTSDEVEQRSLTIIREAQAYLQERSVAEPFGALDPARAPLATSARRERAAALFPHLRGVAARDSAAVGHFTDSDVVLDFLAREKCHDLVHSGRAAPTTSCAPRCGAAARHGAGRPGRRGRRRLAELEAEYRDEYRAYYERHATADSPAMRGRRPGDRPRARGGDVLLRWGQADRPGGR